MNTSSTDVARSFLEQLKTDKGMLAAAQEADTEEQILDVARTFGFEFSAEDIRNAVDEAIGNISEDDLDAIAAGGGRTFDTSAIPASGYSPQKIQLLIDQAGMLYRLSGVGGR